MSRKTSSRPNRAARATGHRAAEAARQRARRRWQVATVVAAGAVLFGVVAAFSFAPNRTTAPEKGYSADKANFDLPALTGDGHVRLADHRGRPVVVNFFASWCVYCNEELPGFVEVAKATRGSVDFIGVQTSDTGDGVAMANRFDLAGAGFSLAKDIGPAPGSQLWSAFGSNGLPVTAFYDRTGALVDFSGGMLTQDALEQRLKKDFGVDAHAAAAAAKVQPVIPLIPQGAAELIRNGAGGAPFVVLDLRGASDFAAGHLPGATNLDAASPQFRDKLKAMDRDASYIVYGATTGSATSAAETMHQMQFKHVYEITSGVTGWQQAGLPLTQ